MKDQHYFLFLCFITAFLFSCSENKKIGEDQSFIELNVEDAINNSRAFDVTEKFSNTEFIPLETKDIALVGEVIKIVKKGDYYIQDENGNLLRFDIQGRFVNRIGKIGNGPKEYNVITDFVVDGKNGHVIINSYGKLVFYSIDGEFVKAQKVDNNCQVMELDSEGRIFYILPDDAQPEDSNSAEIVKVINTDGNLVKSFNTDKIRHSGLSYFNSISQKNGTMYYKEEMGNVIYSINSDLEKDSIYSFNLGKYAFAEQDFDMQAMEKWNSLYRFDRLLISGDIAFFNLQKGLMGKDIYPLIWNGKEIVFPHATSDSSKKGLYFNGIRITPMAEDNDEIVCLASIVDILEQKEKENLEIESLNGISEASNPVLFILK